MWTGLEGQTRCALDGHLRCSIATSTKLGCMLYVLKMTKAGSSAGNWPRPLSSSFALSTVAPPCLGQLRPLGHAIARSQPSHNPATSPEQLEYSAASDWVSAMLRRAAASLVTRGASALQATAPCEVVHG